MIHCKDVSHTYPHRDQPSLRGVSFTVRPGETICIMGRNGSGKSTLLKLIAGLIRPTAGEVLINGHAPQSGVDGQIGILFQNPDNQMVAAVVEKELAFAMENRAVPQPTMETRIAEVAASFEIMHLLNRLTSELSGGEKQRVALAAVMIQNPSVLLLDEPDAFLDQHGSQVLEAEIQRIRLASPNMIVMRISQDAKVAAEYPRMIVVDDGVIVADQSPERVLSDHEKAVGCGLVAPSLAAALVMPVSILSEAGSSRPSVDRIKVNAVDLAYESDHPILEGVTCALNSGELIGLVGPTGSGKTSMGLLLTGLLQPAGGEVVYTDTFGHVLTSGDRRGQVVNLLQQPERQFFLRTVREEIAFGPSNFGRSLSSEQIDAYLDLVGLDPSSFLERDPFTLSAGEKRRLAMAAVLAVAPAMAIFDEPTAGLDPAGVARFEAISTALKQAGCGQLLVTHDLDLLGRLADRVLVLDRTSGLTGMGVTEYMASVNLAVS